MMTIRLLRSTLTKLTRTDENQPFQQKAIKNEKNKSHKIQACACFAFKFTQGLNLGVISCLRP